MNEKERFFDVKLVAEYIHVSKSLIYLMVSKKQIPFIKIGSRTIFDRQQIDQWVLNGCRMIEELPQLPSL
jgi:excisionase family DNA binding protein